MPRSDADAWYRTVWSPEVRVVLRPYTTMKAAVAEVPATPRWWLAMRRPLLLLLVIGAMISYTSAGKLVVGHLAWAMIAYAFLVVLQLVGLTATIALFARQRLGPRLRGMPHMIDTSYLQRAPWLAFLLLFTLYHATRGDPGASIFSVWLGRPVIIAMVACMVWSRVIDHAFWRALGLGRLKALVAVLVHDVLVLGPGIGWYLVTEQLQPLLEGL